LLHCATCTPDILLLPIVSNGPGHGVHGGFQLEHELIEAGIRVDFAPFTRLARDISQQQPVLLVLHDRVTDGSGTHVKLGPSHAEEASAGESGFAK
jgi:hypothetical protein